jgi:hypothetical protein
VNGPVRAVVLAEPVRASRRPRGRALFATTVSRRPRGRRLRLHGGPLRYACPMRPFMRDDPSSPAGRTSSSSDGARDGLDGSTTAFLGRPGIGLLAAGVPPVPTRALAPTSSCRRIWSTCAHPAGTRSAACASATRRRHSPA